MDTLKDERGDHRKDVKNAKILQFGRP